MLREQRRGLTVGRVKFPEPGRLEGVGKPFCFEPRQLGWLGTSVGGRVNARGGTGSDGEAGSCRFSRCTWHRVDAADRKPPCSQEAHGDADSEHLRVTPIT